MMYIMYVMFYKGRLCPICEILLQSMKPAITHLLQSGRAFRDPFCNVLCNVYGVSNKMGIATNSTVNRISMHSHD